MDHRTCVNEHFDGRAATYDDNAMHRDLVVAVADVVGDPGVTVVDVATGTGLMLRALARRHPRTRLVGVDLSARMLQVARRELPQGRWIRADAERLPLPDGTADLLTCITALHLFADPDAVIAEWRRVVRPDGRVVTATFSALARPPQPGAGGYVRRHEPFQDPDRVAQVLGRHGFKLDRNDRWSDGRDELLICSAARVDG